tara:strand:+ start:23 stop:961 length:939 start_codon:yes stop_codon:yes gene_type:complete
MFLKHLINPKPSVILVFIVFCVLFGLFPLIQFKTDAVFTHSHLHPIIVSLLAILIPLFLSTGLNNIIYEKNIIRKENLVIGFVFILISSSFVNTVELWIYSFLLLFLFNFLLESYQKDMPLSQFYNASIILSSLTFVYPNLIFLVLLLIISGINYSNLSWRIIFTIFLGLITPYFFYFVFVYIMERPFNLPAFFDFSQVNFSNIHTSHISKISWISTILLIILLSFFELFMWLYKKSIKSRRTFMTIFWFLIISILIANYSGWEYFYFSLMPLAIIIGNYFVYTKNRKIANILFTLLVSSSFYYKYMILYNV